MVRIVAYTKNIPPCTRRHTQQCHPIYVCICSRRTFNVTKNDFPAFFLLFSTYLFQEVLMTMVENVHDDIDDTEHTARTGVGWGGGGVWIARGKTVWGKGKTLWARVCSSENNKIQLFVQVLTFCDRDSISARVQRCDFGMMGCKITLHLKTLDRSHTQQMDRNEARNGYHSKKNIYIERYSSRQQSQVTIHLPHGTNRRHSTHERDGTCSVESKTTHSTTCTIHWIFFLC